MTRVLKMVMLAALMLLISVMVGCAANVTPPQVVQVNNQAPDFRLPGRDGQEISLSDFVGRPVLLNFWASWCGPCRSETPFIQEVFEDEEWTNKGLVILAVNIGEDSATVDRFVKEFALTFTVLLDTDQEAAQKYYIRGIPTTFFIDKNGIIKSVKIGAFAGKEEIDRRLIDSIVEEK